MNEKKLKHLLQAARGPVPVAPSPEFADDVARVARTLRIDAPVPETVPETLAAWAPRLAVACVALMATCALAEWSMNPAGLPSISDGLTELSGSWLFALNGV